jgi:hypothetical protein
MASLCLWKFTALESCSLWCNRKFQAPHGNAAVEKSKRPKSPTCSRRESGGMLYFRPPMGDHGCTPVWPQVLYVCSCDGSSLYAKIEVYEHSGRSKPVGTRDVIVKG